MDHLSIKKAMLRNILDKSDKDIAKWISFVKKTNFIKHSEIMKYLKSKFYLTDGYANQITRKTLNKR
tara:strand:+ start:1154 stop:1354 length:201 start_codon:yes stop_codon:yes gene_type:complete